MLECGYDVEALDASIEAQKLVKQKLSQCPDIESKANFTHLDVNATQLSYPDGNFDYITCLSVLSLLGSREKVEVLLKEFVRVMKSGAKIIIDINDPISDFARGLKHLGNDVYLQGEGSSQVHPCYCPDKETFVDLISTYFEIDDIGYSAHKLFHSEIHEHIISAHKN